MFLEDIILLIYPLAENQLKSEKESHQTDYFERKSDNNSPEKDGSKIIPKPTVKRNSLNFMNYEMYVQHILW